MKTNMHFLSNVTPFFSEWKMFQIKVEEKIKTHFVWNNFFFRTFCRLRDNVEKYCREGQATDDNMEQAHCMLDT
jgi:hypothetical protein